MFQQTATKYQKLSRSKIDLFVQCELCFYLDRVKGIPRPSGLPFTLNSAVDTVLKTEFDVYREKGARHPLMEKYAVDAVPAKHPKLDIWRQNFKGIRYDDDDSQLTITGAIDDLWLNFNNEYIIVDYKSTSKAEQITRLDKEWLLAIKGRWKFISGYLPKVVSKFLQLAILFTVTQLHLVKLLITN